MKTIDFLMIWENYLYAETCSGLLDSKFPLQVSDILNDMRELSTSTSTYIEIMHLNTGEKSWWYERTDKKSIYNHNLRLHLKSIYVNR